MIAAYRIRNKQVSLYIPIEDWKLIRGEAAVKRISITELVLAWMSSDMEKLRRNSKK